CATDAFGSGIDYW
nr:immunoglobulin heavy chain junction region [Macaca mulatta]MOV87608.1 immunoglobulin heavy chain junction region [Macaca mulatta]MOV91252.1 immunoglobulin heavy chain junction region [Macaca mulatta]MOW76094.1 immunoglobulin heavy chain junction region [Macaca mulatta]MOW81340.1 immunoglobulin heavy chain junction region [Macaca mulatta]